MLTKRLLIVQLAYISKFSHLKVKRRNVYTFGPARLWKEEDFQITSPKASARLQLTFLLNGPSFSAPLLFFNQVYDNQQHHLALRMAF